MKAEQTKNRLIFAGGRGWWVREIGVHGQRVQPSSYKVNIFWGYINNKSLAIMLTAPY